MTYRFESRLQPAELLRRYKRFLADVRLADGRVVTAHCANTGSMLGCCEPGSQALVLHCPGPTRKLAYSLEAVRADATWVAVNTGRANHVVANAIRDGLVPQLAGYESMRREVLYGHGSRVDLLLEGAGGRCFVEVKSVTLARDGVAYFPDAVTDRGTRHLQELARVRKRGDRAVVFLLVNRADCKVFRPASHIDGEFSKTLRQVARKGVQVVSYWCELEPWGLRWGREIGVELAASRARN